MAIAMMDKTGSSDFVGVAKTSPLKKLARQVVQQWQRIVEDRQQLWQAYGTSAYARNTPRCVWRRHGALLMYARHGRPLQQGMPQRTMR